MPRFTDYYSDGEVKDIMERIVEKFPKMPRDYFFPIRLGNFLRAFQPIPADWFRFILKLKD